MSHTKKKIIISMNATVVCETREYIYKSCWSITIMGRNVFWHKLPLYVRLKVLLQSLQLVFPGHSLSKVQLISTMNRVSHHCHWSSVGTWHDSMLQEYHGTCPLCYSAVCHCHRTPGGLPLQSNEEPVFWWCRLCFLHVTVVLVVCLMLASDLEIWQ